MIKQGCWIRLGSKVKSDSNNVAFCGE